MAGYADLLICRDLLEFTPSPGAFLRNLRSCMAANPRAVLFCAVPNLEYLLDRHSYWQFGYEQENFFTVEALCGLLESAGFRILGISDLSEGRYIGIEVGLVASNGTPPSSSAREVTGWTRRLARFAAHYQGILDKARVEVASRARLKKRGVMLGAAAGEVTCLNLLELPRDQVAFAIDDDRGRANTFFPGMGQEVRPMVFLQEYRPDYVLSIDSRCTTPCREYLRQTGITVEFVSLG